MSIETQKVFIRLLRDLRPLFQENGFRPSGQSFIHESDQCWVIINFQKSRYSQPDETTFYVNVAACAKRWLGFAGKPAEKVPPYYGCDWQWRVEHFSSDKTIKQWTLRDDQSFKSTFTYLQTLFRDSVIPAAQTMTTEAGLMDHTGGYEYPQLKTRSVIFAATAQVEALRPIIATLLEKYGSGGVSTGVNEHIALLRLMYPEVMAKMNEVF